MTGTLVPVTHGQVVCPSCLHKFPVQARQQSGQGAAYVQEWDRLPRRCHDILTVWLSNAVMREAAHEKKDIRRLLRLHGLQISEDSINARISELLGLRLITSTPEIKPANDAHQTSRPIPVYSLDLARAVEVVNHGGRLH